ncbi:hypothetical protein [Dictyobacter arantiisoli]|uniref:Uncharacterized protein n=1 Tax=Dictyobacter arantiisoli TaxID=2014874 RepID=A0A5A5TKS6_9CHLR|nr:hypothetical protein [Dictyobacter arantiisoli]GCF11524.1 hypothetical protein KDI_50880 [Dictyobacter arantiisoli]
MPEIRPSFNGETPNETATDFMQEPQGLNLLDHNAVRAVSDRIGATERDYTKEYYGIKPSSNPEVAAQRRSDWMRASDQITGTNRSNYPRDIIPDNSQSYTREEAWKLEIEGIKAALKEKSHDATAVDPLDNAGRQALQPTGETNRNWQEKEKTSIRAKLINMFLKGDN